MHTTRRASSKINRLTIDDENSCRITRKQMSWKLERGGSGEWEVGGERVTKVRR